MSEVNNNSDSPDSKLLESVSALMDGEASELELRRILKESKQDVAESEALLKRWSSYHLISSALKNEVHSKPAVNLLDGINARLADEPALESRKQSDSSVAYASATSQPSGLFRTLFQGAVAASVTFAVLFSVGNFDNADTTASMASNGGDESSFNVESDSGLPALNGTFSDSSLSRTVNFETSMDQAARERLQQAVLNEFLNKPTATTDQPFSEFPTALSITDTPPGQ